MLRGHSRLFLSYIYIYIYIDISIDIYIATTKAQNYSIVRILKGPRKKIMFSLPYSILMCE